MFKVWHIGLCQTCMRRLESSKYGKAQLFLEHILGVVQFIKDTYPTLRIIMWDDMLRSIDTTILIGKYYLILIDILAFQIFQEYKCCRL